VTGMGGLLGRSFGRGMNGIIFGQESLSDLDYADHVSISLPSELPVPVLEVLREEAAPLGLDVNWQKTIVQALGSMKDEFPSLLVCGHALYSVC